MLHNLNKYHKTIKAFKHYVHLNAKQIHRYNTSQCPYLDQVTLRWEAQAVDSVCPAVSPLTKLLWRLGESHVGSDGAVDDGLGGKNQMQHDFGPNRKKEGWKFKDKIRRCFNRLL